MENLDLDLESEEEEKMEKQTHELYERLVEILKEYPSPVAAYTLSNYILPQTLTDMYIKSRDEEPSEILELSLSTLRDAFYHFLENEMEENDEEKTIN